MADGDELHGMIVHFSCEHSYFCGKTRAYLRFKQQAKSSETLRADVFGCTATVQFQDVLVTGGPSGVRAELERLTGSPAIPQVRLEDGKTYVQDTAAIIDAVEARHPEPAISPSPSAGPRQLLASYLLELFADEWMIAWCYHSRWRSNMKTVNAAGVVRPGDCAPAREGSCQREAERGRERQRQRQRQRALYGVACTPMPIPRANSVNAVACCPQAGHPAATTGTTSPCSSAISETPSLRSTESAMALELVVPWTRRCALGRPSIFLTRVSTAPQRRKPMTSGCCSITTC